MKVYDKKVQMMDAGMQLFESGQNYGLVLGQVKAEMEVYGPVLKSSEFEGAEFPESTGECDLFMDYSTFWRVRYISCHLEGAGTVSEGENPVYRYAATFKEGNRSTLFRGISMFLVVAACVVAMLAVPGLFKLAFIALGLFAGYVWIRPSAKAQAIVSALQKSLQDIR